MIIYYISSLKYILYLETLSKLSILLVNVIRINVIANVILHDGFLLIGHKILPT